MENENEDELRKLYENPDVAATVRGRRLKLLGNNKIWERIWTKNDVRRKTRKAKIARRAKKKFSEDVKEKEGSAQKIIEVIEDAKVLNGLKCLTRIIFVFDNGKTGNIKS